jgi:hypothetical protein
VDAVAVRAGLGAVVPAVRAEVDRARPLFSTRKCNTEETSLTS